LGNWGCLCTEESKQFTRVWTRWIHLVITSSSCNAWQQYMTEC
jgi:hypothetical protein